MGKRAPSGTSRAPAVPSGTVAAGTQAVPRDSLESPPPRGSAPGVAPRGTVGGSGEEGPRCTLRKHGRSVRVPG